MTVVLSIVCDDGLVMASDSQITDSARGMSYPGQKLHDLGTTGAWGGNVLAIPKVSRNKEAALHIMRELLQCNQWDRAGEWLTDAYHQHNPNAASGLKGVVTYFTQVVKVKRNDTCGKLTTEVVAVMADGDFPFGEIPSE